MLVEVDFAVFEVLLASDVLGPFRAVGSPVLPALLLPLAHEFLVFSQFVPVFLALLLLQRVDQLLLRLVLSNCSVEKIFLSDLKLD